MNYRNELLIERARLIEKRKSLMLELDRIAPAYNGLRMTTMNDRSSEIARELNQINNKLIANAAYLELA